MHSDLEAFLFQKFLLGLLSCGCRFRFWFFGQLFTIYVTTIISVNDRVPRSNFLMLDFLHGSSHNVSLCWIFLCGHGTTNHRKLVLAKLPHYVSNLRGLEKLFLIQCSSLQRISPERQERRPGGSLPRHAPLGKSGVWIFVAPMLHFHVLHRRLLLRVTALAHGSLFWYPLRSRRAQALLFL